MNIHECETRNNIVFPEEYRNIINKSNSHWMNQSTEWIIENEEALILGNAFAFPTMGDFKLIPFEKIEQSILELYEMINMDIEYSNEDIKINPEYKLVPFAKMSSGDIYCFCNGLRENSNIIIVYGHDTGDFDVWANNFEELVFMQLVSCIVDYGEDIKSSYVAKHVDLLPESYIKLFDKLSNEELNQYINKIDLPNCPSILL